MLKRAMLGSTAALMIFVAIFLGVIVDWRKPEDIISQRWYVSVRASDMRCLMNFDDEYTIMDTLKYDDSPFLMTFLQPVYDTEIFTKKEHTIEVLAVPVQSPKSSQLSDIYCEVSLGGSVEDLVQRRYNGDITAKIKLSDDGNVVVTGHDPEGTKLTIERNEEGAIQYISVIQSLWIDY